MKRWPFLLLILCVGAACSGSSSGGAKLALGTEVTLPYATTASGSTPAVSTTLGVKVLDVRIGTQKQLSDAGIQVEAADTSATPYYIDVQYANKGAVAMPRSLSVGLEQTDGNDVPTLLNFAYGVTFDLCNDHNTGTLDPGQSYQGCTLLLVPKGKTVDRVRFVSQAPDAKITFTDWAVK